MKDKNISRAMNYLEMNINSYTNLVNKLSTQTKNFNIKLMISRMLSEGWKQRIASYWINVKSKLKSFKF